MITLDTIRKPVTAELEAFDGFVDRQFTAEGELLADMLRYALSSRGKGIRPLLVMLSAAMNSPVEGAAKGRRVHLAAMLVEMIHVASLIHDDVIEIPAEHMKKRKPFRLPLTGFMRELLEREAALSPHPRCAFVFAARVTGRHISAQALAKHLHSTELKGRLVAHGLRSIARSWLADAQVPYEVAETCLSHDVGSLVSRAYQRSDYFDARRSIMERWSEHVRACARCAGMID